MAIDPNNLQGTAHVTFDDEFNSLNLWSASNPSGAWSTTFWYQDANSSGASLPNNGEQEWYINANYGPTSSVQPWGASNGVLTLTAAPASSAISSLINGYGYTSGEVNTYHSFSQTYGYFEMRAQLPSGQGFWPAFWLMPTDGSWPPELDVMEVLGNNTSILYNTVHSATNGTVGNGGTQVADMAAGYHTYGVDWESDYITFYFDGQEVYQTATPADMHKPMYMIANLAAGGSWPGNVNPGSVGQMNIDYVRAYAPGGDGSAASSSPTYTGTPPTSLSPTAPEPSQTQTQTQTQTSPTGGQTFWSDNNGDWVAGTSGNDTFNLGRGGDHATGGGGADTFKFAEVPWTGGHITDFGSDDVLDLSAMFSRYGYTNNNSFTDGHLSLSSDGQGGAQIWFNMDGLWSGSGTWLVTTLDGVSPSSLSISNGLITEGAAASSSSSSTSAPAQPSGSSSAGGQTFTSDNNGDHWTGTSGNDAFNLGRGGDTVTGAGGADTFKFAEVPWAGGHITDFDGSDALDLSAMFARYGYTNSNTLSDGHLSVTSDGQGGTQIWFDMDGLSSGSGTWLVTTLDHVDPSSLSISNGVITESGSSWSSGGSCSSTTGQTFWSDNNGDHWTGTSGADAFNLGRGGDTVTGNGGGDTFVLHETPWAGGHITDFSSGDTMDLTGLLQIDGWSSGDAVAQGYLKVTADSAGEAQVWSHLDGQWWLVDTLDHVAPSSVHVNGAFITG